MSRGGGCAHSSKGAQDQKLSLQAVSGVGYSIQEANCVPRGFTEDLSQSGFVQQQGYFASSLLTL